MGEAPRGGQLITWSNALIILLGITAHTLKREGRCMPTVLAGYARYPLTEGHLVFNIDILPDGQPEKPGRDQKSIGKDSRKQSHRVSYCCLLCFIFSGCSFDYFVSENRHSFCLAFLSLAECSYDLPGSVCIVDSMMFFCCGDAKIVTYFYEGWA